MSPRLPYVGHLITHVRNESDNNVETGDTEAITTNTILTYVNNAVDYLVTRISREYHKIFQGSQEITIAADKYDYALTGNILLGSKVYQVEYSPDGQARNYCPIQCVTEDQIRYTKGNIVDAYTRFGDIIRISPTPAVAKGSLRIIADIYPDLLDIRRGKVTTVTGTPITSITVSSGDDSLGNLVDGDYISVVDKYGVPKANAVPVTSATTSTITVPNHTLRTGESISANDYVCIGAYSTTHSTLHRSCQEFLQEYTAWKCLRDDEAEKAQSYKRRLFGSERDGGIIGGIVEAYRAIYPDIVRLPFEDEAYLL